MDVFLDLLRTFTEQGREVSAARGSKYAPRILAEHPGAEAKGVRQKDLQKAMERLLGSGEIRVETYGPQSRREQRLVLR